MNTKKKKAAEFGFDPVTRKPAGALPDFNLHQTTLLPHPAFDTVQCLETLSDVKVLPATYLPTSPQRIQYFSGNNNITAQLRNSEATFHGLLHSFQLRSTSRVKILVREGQNSERDYDNSKGYGKNYG